MPRLDLAALGIAYRRIPILAIGRDVYCDTRLILRKLETLYSDTSGPPLGADTLESIGIQRLLENWTIEGGVFMRSVQLVPVCGDIHCCRTRSSSMIGKH